MTDTAQGPDWWLASDGKWYPPTSRPQPPTPPPPRPPAPVVTVATTVSPTLAGWIQGLLWTAAGLAGIRGFIVLAEIGSYRSWNNGEKGMTVAELVYGGQAYENVYSFFSSLGSLVGLALFVLFLIWANRCHKTAARLHPAVRKWSSGWTVGAWFIPLANAVLPKLVLDETERISSAPRSGGQLDPSWRSQPVAAIGSLWWISLIGMYLFGFISGSVSVDASGSISANNAFSPDSGRIYTGYALMLVSCALGSAAGVLGVFYVRNISRALSPQAMAGLP